ncbi:Uncharacterised protein [Mycobacteroides abscessus subsp. abscessus]|nr:Uncharacterised protein [Mycobacteroides abscessus subsp. abscessus]
MQSMLATMAGRDAARNDRGSETPSPAPLPRIGGRGARADGPGRVSRPRRVCRARGGGHTALGWPGAPADARVAV